MIRSTRSRALVALLAVLALTAAACGGGREDTSSDEDNAAATEHTGDLILITRPDGSFEHANTAFQRALGYTRDELATRKFVDLIEPGMDHLQRDIPAEVRAKSIWRGTLKGRRKDGSSFPAACTCSASRSSPSCA